MHCLLCLCSAIENLTARAFEYGEPPATLPSRSPQIDEHAPDLVRRGTADVVIEGHLEIPLSRSDGHGHSQKSRRNGRAAVDRAGVLALEEGLELLL